MIALPTQNGHPPPGELPTGGDPLEYISASRLKSFLTCRLKFYFEKVQKLRRPTGPNLHFGKAVHAGLQHFNLARWRGGDSSEDAVVAAFHQAFDHDNPSEPVAWASPEARQDLRAKGDPLLRAFLAQQFNAPDEKPVGVEVTLEANIPSLALPLLGVIDLLKADYSPVDYKTIAATPDLELESWLHEIQITAYALLIEDATGELPPCGELVFLVKTKTPKVITHRLASPNDTQRDRFARLVETYATAVANEHYYPSPGMHCGWCSYRTECAAWKGGQ